MNLKMVRFQQRMRKKMIFQYRYCISAVEKITFSYLGSSYRESTNDIATHYVLLSISRTS